MRHQMMKLVDTTLLEIVLNLTKQKFCYQTELEMLFPLGGILASAFTFLAHLAGKKINCMFYI
jgi:hypothetical protein